MKIKDTNKIIHVDLATEKIEVKDVPTDLLRKYLGGRGLNSHLLNKYTHPNTDPLGPENVLIVGAGLLTGLKGLNFSRATITAKSPESGLLGDANIGGGFPVNLRKNGYGYIVVHNQAKTPKMLVVNNKGITIEDASSVWGLDTQDTQAIIHKHYPHSEILCIGPAGENKVVFACVINRLKNAAARCGMGAVMGSKNLKAIVCVDNDEDLEVDDKKAFLDSIREMNRFLQNEFLMDRLKEYGSSHLYEIVNESIGMGRVKNGQTLAFKENENINPANLKKYYKKKAGCKHCVVRCQQLYEYKGITSEGPEYGVMAHLGPVLGIGHLESGLVLNDVVNRLGMDASSSANVIAWAIDLFEKGLLSKELTEGKDLVWSSFDLVNDLLHDIAYRKGMGSFLADGPREMLKNLPKETENYLCWTKQLVQSEPADLRFLPAYAISNSVASRGSDHLRSRPIWVAFEFPPESMVEVYGEALDMDAFSYEGKGKVVVWWEHYLGMFDILGLCKFLGFHTLPPGVKYSFFKGIIKSAIGFDFTEAELQEVGERLINVERLYIQNHGLSRQDDYPPQKVFLPLEDLEGVRDEDKDRVLDKEKYDMMLDEYYDKRGWNKNGTIPQKTLQRLQIF